MITEIIAAGAMGVSVFFCIKAHSLLKDEQAKDNPRPSILRSIYIFMGFALLMTPVALGIEYARHQMNLDNVDNDQEGLAKVLEDFAGEGHYAVDKNGNPEALELTFAGKNYQLAQPYPASKFGDTPLMLKPGENGRYLALRDNNGKEILYGYFPESNLKTSLAGLFPAQPPPVEGPKKESEIESLYAAGLAYTPSNIRNQLRLQSITDFKKANARLVDFLGEQGFDDDGLRGGAVKLLMQPDMLVKLSEKGHNRLIELLSDNEVRTVPWRYYELAQVYLSRYKLNGKTNPEDLEKHKELSRSYLQDFKDRNWTAETHPGEYTYYRSAAKAITGKELDCATCLLD